MTLFIPTCQKVVKNLIEGKVGVIVVPLELLAIARVPSGGYERIVRTVRERKDTSELCILNFLILPRTLDPQTFAIVGGSGIGRLHQVVEKIDSDLKYKHCHLYCNCDCYGNYK